MEEAPSPVETIAATSRVVIGSGTAASADAPMNNIHATAERMTLRFGKGMVRTTIGRLAGKRSEITKES